MRMDVTKLPPLWLAYLADPSDSGKPIRSPLPSLCTAIRRQLARSSMYSIHAVSY